MNIIKNMLTNENFTVLEKEIINYIFENRDDIVNMSIASLATETFSSNTAIIRLCKKLGVSGFKEFKIKFALELEKRRQERNLIDYNFPFHKLENTAEVCKDIANLTTSTIETVYKEMNVKILREVSQMIFNSQNVYLFAGGDSLIRADSFANKLIKIGITLINTSLRGEKITYSSFASTKDCALFITYSASNSEDTRCAQILKARGVPIITITSNTNATLTKISDYVISFPDNEDEVDSIATFYSQISIEYILNVLYSLIYIINYEKNQKEKNKIDNIRIKNRK